MGKGGLVGRIEQRAARAGIDVDAALANRLAMYLGVLFRWNRRVNLTSLGEDDRGVDRLIVEPLVAARWMPAGARSVVDIGTGGGSPAVPLKLAVPGLGLRMVESRARKAAFLRDVVRQLALQSVVVEACRYQELVGRPELFEAADVVTVRAVKVDREALEAFQALLRVGGALLLFGGPEEDGVRREALGRLRWRGSYPLVESLRSRLVVLEKTVRRLKREDNMK